MEVERLAAPMVEVDDTSNVGMVQGTRRGGNITSACDRHMAHKRGDHKEKSNYSGLSVRSRFAAGHVEVGHRAYPNQ
jgi:hypothetical protein